ncbi:MAG: NUDIX domain-containing protein [Candidatus Heimdallarchaeota archaeon]
MEIGKSKEAFSGKWLVVKIVPFHDKTGKEKLCEFVERKFQRKVATIICKSRDTGKILLVSQYRIPIAAVEVAFPAGLVENGESIEKAALRELREETGYNARIISISNPLPKSAGLTNELSSLVLCEADENSVGAPNMDDTEEITSMWIKPSEFFDRAQEWSSNKIRIAHEVYAYFLGICGSTS